MALYLGNSEKLKLITSNSVCKLIIPTSSSPIINSIRLMSLDNYILKDSNGVYLTAKEGK